MAVTQLGYLGINASNLSGWEEFATSVLGLQLIERGGNGTLYLRSDEYHHRFAIYPSGGDGLAYIGWQVANERVLEDTVTRIEEYGIKTTPGTPEEIAERKVVGLVKLTDPNGFPIELFYGPMILADQPFYPGRPMVSGFNTGPLGLGHVGVSAPNFKDAQKFYQEVLGFRVSDYAYMGKAVFLHCNGRHHSMVLLNTPTAPKALRHFMIEVKSIDDVGHALDLCYEKGAPIKRSLGRHVNDKMISFYVTTPSGFDVEYGWGGRVVDDATWEVQQHVKSRAWGAQNAEHEQRRANTLLSAQKAREAKG
jgi:2,3-dihydroxybiphenyl 1,2-dioxygenase